MFLSDHCSHSMGLVTYISRIGIDLSHNCQLSFLHEGTAALLSPIQQYVDGAFSGVLIASSKLSTLFFSLDASGTKFHSLIVAGKMSHSNFLFLFPEVLTLRGPFDLCWQLPLQSLG